MALVAMIAASFASGAEHRMVQARERRVMMLSGLQKPQTAQFSEATRAKLRNRLRLLIRQLKLIDDEFDTQEIGGI